MSVQHKDTTYTKIFVGGLPYHTTDASLREYFAVFGDIEEAVVITDRQTGKSRGYGFVTMSDQAAAERACKDANPVIDGRKANVNLAYIGAKPRVLPASVGLRQLSTAYFPASQLPTGGLQSAVYAYPQQTPAAPTYLAHNGVLLPTQPAQQAIMDYAGGLYAPAQIPGAYATDVAAAATAPALVNAYATHLHPSAQSLGLSSVAGTPQLIAAAPTQAGLHVAASQGIGSYHHASAVAAYAAVSPNALTQPHNIATTPAPGAYAHLATHLQQQTAERF